MQNLLTDGSNSTTVQNEIVPVNVTVEPGNTETTDIIDLDEDEAIVHDISSVGGAWEASHADATPRPAPKGRPDYKTQKQRLLELEAAYLKAKDALDEEWEAYEKKMKALKKKRKKALKRNNKLIAVEYDQSDFVGDYPDIVEEKLMDVGFSEISFYPIKDVLANNIDMLDVVENVVVNSILHFQSKDLFPYDCPIVINYHEKARLEIPFSASELKKMTIEEVEKALTDVGFSNITKTAVQLSGLNFLKKPGRIESFKVHGFGLTLEHQTAEFDEPIEITYYTK
ncbi:MAG: hypothetical protein MJ116_04410 [Lachnospiraceae bacterium]|nr:hypothetical protein [Lachnospiraceae bacterium]